MGLSGRSHGSLMVDSAALLGSVRVESTPPEMVIFSAGNDKVPYAQVHNEGGRAGRGAGFDMPKRQFIGQADELDAKILARMKGLIDANLK